MQMQASTSIQEQVELELLRIFYRQTLMGQFAGLVCAALFCVIAYEPGAITRIAWWLAATVLAAGLRLLLAHQFLQADRAGTSRPTARTVAVVRVSTLLSGLIWGLGSLALLEHVSGTRQLAMYLIPIGMVSGAIPRLAPVRNAYGLYASSILLPFAVSCLTKASLVYFVMAILAIFFLYMLLSSAEQLRILLTDTLQLRMEKEKLSQALLASHAAALDAQQEAELANRAKSEFLASMSHEIRTPMNAILGLTHLALDSNGVPQRDYLQKIRDAGQMLFRLLNDVLDLSKIEAGHMELELASFEPRAVVSQCAATVAPLAREKGLRFDVRIAGNVPDHLIGDATRLTQVLMNLLGNAVKFTTVGTVELLVKIVEQKAATVTMQFAVSDTGIGLDEEEQRRVFTAYAQADASINRRYGGTGLGLSITRQLVELMRGQLTVSSEPGLGSTFTVTLPLTRAQDVPAQQNAPGQTWRFDGIRILAVEDNAVNQLITRELLERQGAIVEVADNGRAAINAATAAAFDLILMDVMMPEMDGLEATRRLRELTATAEVPIIGLTANVNREDLAACLEAGMNAHVGKPIVPDDLFARLAEWLPGVAPGSARPTAASDAFDPTLALARYGNDEDLLRQMFEVFIETEADAPARLRAALANDPLTARRICHNLRGLAAGFDAPRLSAAARIAETELATTGSLPAEAHTELNAAHAELLAAARAYLDTPALAKTAD